MEEKVYIIISEGLECTEVDEAADRWRSTLCNLVLIAASGIAAQFSVVFHRTAKAIQTGTISKYLHTRNKRSYV